MSGREASSDGQNERELVARAAKGDAVALKLLLTAHHPKLLDFISGKVPPDVSRVIDADDIIQEAEIKIFRSIGSFDYRGPGSFFRWTASIALNCLRNAIQHEHAIKRGGATQLDGALPKNIEESTIALLTLVAAVGGTPSRPVTRAEAVAAVHKAIEELPREMGRAVWLVHIEERTLEHTARLMDRSQRNVRDLCREGLKLLRERIADPARFWSSVG